MEHFRHALTIFAVAALLAPARGAHAGRPVFHHHRADHEGEDQDHTRNRSAKPARASVPGLTLHSRSLLGKDGKTEVEISTALFDIGATPPGNTSQCDIRAVEPTRRGKDDDDNQLTFHKRYERLGEGGYVHWKHTGLPHAQPLRIRAEARAGWRGGEVEAKWFDVVRYRPDLAVQMVDAPGLTPVNTMVQVNATVVERMDEVGAHADCVLLVDGAQVDVAPGIWVDASGSAVCRFTTSFASGGLHTIQVVAQNVKPGDYDDSNNAFSRQIQVQNSATLYYDMAVMDQPQTQTSASDNTFYSSNTCKSLALGCAPGDVLQGAPDGKIVTLGGDYAADFTLEDGSVYTAKPNMNLPVVSGSTTPSTTVMPCTATDFGTGTMGKICVQTVTTNYVRQGESTTLPASN